MMGIHFDPMNTGLTILTRFHQDTTMAYQKVKKPQMKKEWKDTGMYDFGQLWHEMYQVICGQHCPYCRDRAEEHHAHYLQRPGPGPEPERSYAPEVPNQPTATQDNCPNIPPLYETWADIPVPKEELSASSS